MLEEESDEEMRELAKEELNDAKNRVAELENELKILLLPKDPNDDKNVIVEIRAGAGGDEAALFAAEIYRMYQHYAETKNWKTEIMECDDTGIGGMKSVTFMITGAGAYSVMKYESGVHRVQRVPETESGGRSSHNARAISAVVADAPRLSTRYAISSLLFSVPIPAVCYSQTLQIRQMSALLPQLRTFLTAWSESDPAALHPGW